MNFAALEDGRIVELQGTAEGAPFERVELDAMLVMAENGVRDLIAMQQDAIKAQP
jgi:ribonuclease PH